MTEPTWKDPLLREWAKDCAPETLRYLGADSFDSSPVAMLDIIDAMPPPFRTDRDRLRSLIDAELARGREAVEVLREVQWEAPHYGDYQACPACERYAPGCAPSWREDAEEGHAPDCRLAKVIKP